MTHISVASQHNIVGNFGVLHLDLSGASDAAIEAAALDVCDSPQVAASNWGGAMARKLFCIWNRAYKQQYIVANDIDEAVQIARDNGHTRRGHRRWKDCSDLAATPIDGATPENLHQALSFGESGCATLEPEGWRINGKPTWS